MPSDDGAAPPVDGYGKHSRGDGHASPSVAGAFQSRAVLPVPCSMVASASLLGYWLYQKRTSGSHRSAARLPPPERRRPHTGCRTPCVFRSAPADRAARHLRPGPTVPGKTRVKIGKIARPGPGCGVRAIRRKLPSSGSCYGRCRHAGPENMRDRGQASLGQGRRKRGQSPARQATRPRPRREATDFNQRQGPGAMSRNSGLITMRGLAAFTTGALAAVIASRVLPPIVAQAAGSAQTAAGHDPFDGLAEDHRIILSLLDRMDIQSGQRRVRPHAASPSLEAAAVCPCRGGRGRGISAAPRPRPRGGRHHASLQRARGDEDASLHAGTDAQERPALARHRHRTEGPDRRARQAGGGSRFSPSFAPFSTRRKRP